MVFVSADGRLIWKESLWPGVFSVQFDLLLSRSSSEPAFQCVSWALNKCPSPSGEAPVTPGRTGRTRRRDPGSGFALGSWSPAQRPLVRWVHRECRLLFLLHVIWCWCYLRLPRHKAETSVRIGYRQCAWVRHREQHYKKWQEGKNEDISKQLDFYRPESGCVFVIFILVTSDLTQWARPIVGA